MYTLGSTEFNQIIETPNNQSVKKRLVLLDDNTIIDKIKSLTLYSSSSSQELQLGTTNMSYIEAEVDSDLLLTNREVRLECGVTLSDGSEEYIPMGVFTIQKPQGDIDFVKFKAHDNMQKFEKMYVSALDYPTTSALVLDEICNMCGVVLSTPIENPIEITEKLQGYTCREVLGFIAGIHGKFACIDRLGTLNLRWYSDTPIDKQIGLIWAFNKSDDDFTVDKIEIAKDTETNYTSGSGFSAIYHSNPLATQEIADELFAKLNGFTYNASTIDILDDIRLDIWDVIKVIYLDGKEYLVPCMSLKQDFGQGSTSIQSFAKTNTENEYRYNGAMTNYVNRIAMELLLTNRIVATKVDAEYVNSVAITTENFEAKVAEIKELVVEEIDGKYATIDFANIDVANINKTNIGLLFAEVGLLDRAAIVDGHVTGFLDAVEINANKITAGTLIADRLLLRGSEQSILYQLNSLSKNILPYPYYNALPRTNRGITFKDYDGKGGISASGTLDGTGQPFFVCEADRVVLKANKPYTFASNCTNEYGFVIMWFRKPDGSGGSVTMPYTEIRDGVISTANANYISELRGGILYDGVTIIPSQDVCVQLDVRFDTNVGTVTDAIFYPMLVEGTEVLPYEPYRKNTQALTSETINGEVLTDRTITADKIIAKSITSNEIDVAELFANQAAIGTLIAQDAFVDAIETNRIVVGASDKADEALGQVKKTVKSITMHYLATTASSGVTTSTSGWTTTVQQIDATKKYLWTYQTITYADNTTTDTSPVISGVYGNEGVDGKGITSVVPLYYLKSNTTAPSTPTSAVTSTSTGSGVWTKSVPTYVANYTYFTCTQTQYTDGTYKWSTVVADNALTNANKTANTANTNASNAVTTANTANTTANTANSTATTANNTANAIKNNIYKSGTTLIDGGKIFTGTVTADAIATDAIKSQNYVANTSGSFLNLADGSFDSKYLKWNAQGELTATKGNIGNWEIKEGQLLADLGWTQDFDTSTWYGLQLKAEGWLGEKLESALSATELRITHNDGYEYDEYASYGWKSVYFQDYLGKECTPIDFRMSMAEIDPSLDYALGLGENYDLTFVHSTNGLASASDVYANYGTDTQVSLLGLQEKVNYLQPHGYSLIRYTDIGELTTTQKIYTLFNNRKMSDYGMLLITIGVSATDIRETMYVPTLVFSGSDSLPRTLYLECWTDNGATFNQVRIDYVSDTQIKAYLVTSTTKTKYLNIYGVKVDAGLSGRSVDLI